MSGMLSQLKTVSDELHSIRAGWALVGALAVSVHTEPRTTRDIDVAIALKGEESQEDLVDQLVNRGFRNPTILMHVVPTHKLGIRLQVPAQVGTSVALVLLFTSSGIEPEIVASASSLEILPSLFVPVACVGHLLAMKILSQNDAERIRDQADLQSLMAVASEEDFRVARAALSLIEDRGFSRGVELQGALSKAVDM